MQNLRNKGYQILRRSEGFFKTDMVYLARGGFWLSLSQIVATLSGFLISIAFANLISKESFGIYKFVISVAGIVGALSLTGMGIAITRSVANGFEPLRQGFRTNLKWSVGIFFAGVTLAIYYYLQDNTTLSLAFLLMGVFYPINISASLYSPYLLGKKDFSRNSVHAIVYSIVPALIMIGTIYFTENPWMIVGSYFFSGALTAAFLYRQTLRAYWNRKEAQDPELFSYSKHLSAMEIIGRIASQLDKILIFHFLGAAPLAIYSFAIAPVEQLQSGKKILSTLILPKIAGRPFEELQKETPRKTLPLIIYALVLAGLWALIAPYFYSFFYPQYLDSIFYSQIYSLTLLTIAGTLFNETLIAHQKKKALYIHRTIIPVAQIALFIILLPIYGLMGLVVTHISIRCLAAVLGYYFVVRSKM